MNFLRLYKFDGGGNSFKYNLSSSAYYKRHTIPRVLLYTQLSMVPTTMQYFRYLIKVYNSDKCSTLLCQGDDSLCLLPHTTSPRTASNITTSQGIHGLWHRTILYINQRSIPQQGPFTSIATSPPPLLPERQNSNHLQFTDQTFCNCWSSRHRGGHGKKEESQCEL